MADTTPSLRALTIGFVSVFLAAPAAFAQINPLFEGIPPSPRDDANTRQLIERHNQALKNEKLTYRERAVLIEKARTEVRLSNEKFQAAESKRIYEETLERLEKTAPASVAKVRETSKMRDSQPADPWNADDGPATSEEIAAEKKRQDLISATRYGAPKNQTRTAVTGGSGNPSVGIDPSQFPEKLEFKPKE